MHIVKETLPLVSIIIPCYNHARYVEASIKSVLDQSYQNIELIILNDGSTDDTHNIIHRLVDECNKAVNKFVYINKDNEGLTKTLNKGLLLAKGKYISLLASDDIIYKNKIEILVNKFEKCDSSFAVLCANAIYIDAEGERIYFDNTGNYHYKHIEGELFSNVTESIIYFGNKYGFDIDKTYGSYKMELKYNHICDLGCIIRREAVIDVGMYDENVGLEDIDMWLKLTKKYKMKYIDQIVGAYRCHKENSVKTLRDKLLIDKINLILREKDYCMSSGLHNDWNERYLELMITLYINKKYLDLIKYLIKCDLKHLVNFISKKLHGRFIKYYRLLG